MTPKQKSFFLKDKERNGKHHRKAVLFMWSFRTLASSGMSFKKMFARMLNAIFFEPRGVCIETKSIGGGLRMPHLNGIFIHQNVVIGENCTLFHQVTIGANEHREKFWLAPKIGNSVYIGAGAKLIGNISIGDNCRIGANAVVTKDVPANMTVVGYNRMFGNRPIQRDGSI